MLRIRIPATSANLGPGFDSLGIALKIYNDFYFKKIDRGIKVRVIDKNTGQELNIPREKNLTLTAMERLFSRTDTEFDGIEIIEEVTIPLERGLGSSATAVVAGLVGANKILDEPLTEGDILELAIAIEGHPDNVIPAFKGGLIISVMTDKGLMFKKIKVAQNLKIVMIIPEFSLDTKELRKILPGSVDLKDSIFNHSRTALLMSCFYENDWDNLIYAMEDSLHQNHRAKLIPGFKEIVQAGYKAGALGVALSGAGPSILAFFTIDGKEIGQTMVEKFQDFEIKSRYLITGPDNDGLIVET